MTINQFRKDAKGLFLGDYNIDKSNQILHRKFKALLTSLFPDCTIKMVGGFCEDSGFVSKDRHFVYISLSDLRFWDNWDKEILVRTAANDKDYSGGRNNYATLETLQKSVYELLKQEHKKF